MKRAVIELSQQAIECLATLSETYGKEASANSIGSVLHLDSHLGGYQHYLVAVDLGEAQVVVARRFE